MNKEEFVNRSNNIHAEGTYKYDKVPDFLTYRNRIEIFCVKCNEYFWQIGQSHLNGSGHKKCSRLMTKADFINKSIKSHNINDFNYDEVNYVDCNTEVKIFCNTCKKFFNQKPSNHIKGQGCSYCENNKKRKNINNFIEESEKMFGLDIFDYSKVVYVNAKTNIILICKKDNYEFIVTPDNHLNKHSGCPKCAGRCKTTQDVIDEANFVHDFKYKYPNLIFKNVSEKVPIECKIHGEFKQSLHDHIDSGKGCPKCNSSKGELKIERYLKENNINFENQKRFIDCIDVRPLPFDFYLPELNICIEFDGIQHYKMIEFWGGSDKLKTQKIRDDIKNKYCLNNNIYLIRISYADFNNIIYILDYNFRKYKLKKLKII